MKLRDMKDIREGLKDVISLTKTGRISSKYIANELGIPYSTFISNVYRDIIPFQEIILFAYENNVDHIALLYKEK